MEIAELTVGVAGLIDLLDVYIDAVNRVDTYRKFGFESRYIIARFDADKLLLYKWVEAIEIINGKL